MHKRDRLIFLAQTDTTAGLLSKSALMLNRAKGALDSKQLLCEFSSFSALKARGYRVPPFFRPFVRRAKQTSFVISESKSFRVIQSGLHKDFLQNLDWLYSSSANQSHMAFDKDFAKSVADVEVLDRRGIFESSPSRIIKLKGKWRRRLR